MEKKDYIGLFGIYYLNLKAQGNMFYSYFGHHYPYNNLLKYIYHIYICFYINRNY